MDVYASCRVQKNRCFFTEKVSQVVLHSMAVTSSIKETFLVDYICILRRHKTLVYFLMICEGDAPYDHNRLYIFRALIFIWS